MLLVAPAPDFMFIASINTAITGGVSSNLSSMGTCTVTYSGAQKGTVISLGGGNFRYTPNSNTVGIDNFVATFTVPGMQMMGMTMPAMTTTRTVEMRINIPYSPTPDNSYMYQDSTMTQPVSVNYFVLKGNTLSISAADGVLKNDAAPSNQQHLKAYKSADGQYGTVSLSTNGSFVYTPTPGIFDSPAFTIMGLQDTFTYNVVDPVGVPSAPVEVKVDLAKVEIFRNGVNVDTNPAQLNAWVGEKIEVTASKIGNIPAIAKFQWAVGPGALDGYTGYGESDTDSDSDGRSMGKKLLLTSVELKNQSIDFYWFKDGAREVSVEVQAIGQTQSDDASFNIDRNRSHPGEQ